MYNDDYMYVRYIYFLLILKHNFVFFAILKSLLSRITVDYRITTT